MTDSRWETGSCHTLVVSNPTSRAVSTWSASFTLASGTRLRESWSGTVVVTGGLVSVVAPSWGGTIAAGGSVRHFGFCLEGAGDPTGVRAG